MNKLVTRLGAAIILIFAFCMLGTLIGSTVGFYFPVPGRYSFVLIIIGVIVGLVGNQMKG